MLVTHEHLLDGEIDTHGQRLLDVLNDASTSFLRVKDVRVLRRKCATAIAISPEAVIRKSNVALAIPAGDKHESPVRRSLSFDSKRRYSAFLVVLGYEVRGELALKGTDDGVAALCHELGYFFPVPKGRVAFAGTYCRDTGAQVVIVNSDHVSVLQLGTSVTHNAESPESRKGGAVACDQNNVVISPVPLGT
jgi:hypothetical protein